MQPRGFRKTRQRTTIDDRRRRISELYLQGKSQSEIGLEVGLAQPNVSHELKKIREQWRASTVRNYDEAKNIELARIDQIENEAWEAWNRGIGKHIVTTKKDSREDSELTTRTEHLNGDPRYLDVIAGCVKKRCEILGLNAPTKTEISGLDVVSNLLSNRIKRVDGNIGN